MNIYMEGFSCDQGQDGQALTGRFVPNADIGDIPTCRDCGSSPGT